MEGIKHTTDFYFFWLGTGTEKCGKNEFELKGKKIILGLFL